MSHFATYEYTDFDNTITWKANMTIASPFVLTVDTIVATTVTAADVVATTFTGGNLLILDNAGGSTRSLEWINTGATKNYLNIGKAIEIGFIDSPAMPGTGITYIRAIDSNGGNDSMVIDALGAGALFFNLHDGTGGFRFVDGGENDVRLLIDFDATNPILTSNSNTISLDDNALITTGIFTAGQLIIPTTGDAGNEILLQHSNTTGGDLVKIATTFEGFAGGSILFQATGNYQTESARDSQLIFSTATDGVDAGALILTSSQDALFLHDVTVTDNLIVNAGHTKDFGLTLMGSVAVGPLRRGGFIGWQPLSTETSTGFTYINVNDQFTLDSALQSSPTDTGNAWISFADGSASFGGHTMTISAAGEVTFKASNDSSSVADEVTLGGYELSAGNRALAISQEAAVAVETDETKFSHKLPVRINGTTYYIMLTTT